MVTVWGKRQLAHSHPATLSKTKRINLLAIYWISLNSCTHFESHPCLRQMTEGAVHFLEMTDLALARGTNMDEQDRQDGVHVSFQSTIVGEFCATLLVEERSLTRTK
jgi:hypothetical protein